MAARKRWPLGAGSAYAPSILMSELPSPTVPAALVPRLALLACSVFEREIELLTRGATHIAETRFFEMGLHDRPALLRATLQTQMEAVDARTDIEAVVLAYGLCGRGTAELRPSLHPLVIPRAHDCITLFLGSKEAYAERQQRCPGCYYYTPGWNRGRRVPGPERVEQQRAEWAEKFAPEEVEFLLESARAQWAMNDTATYLDLGTADAEAEAAYAQRCAAWLGWRFERLPGDARLLRDLLWGRWDAARFQVIQPGERSNHSPDDQIMRADPA